MSEQTQPIDVKTPLAVPEPAQTSQPAPATPAPAQNDPPKTAEDSNSAFPDGPPQFKRLDLRREQVGISYALGCCGVLCLPCIILKCLEIREMKKKNLEEYEEQLARYHEQQQQLQMQSMSQQQPEKTTQPGQVPEPVYEGKTTQPGQVPEPVYEGKTTQPGQVPEPVYEGKSAPYPTEYRRVEHQHSSTERLYWYCCPFWSLVCSDDAA